MVTTVSPRASPARLGPALASKRQSVERRRLGCLGCLQLSPWCIFPAEPDSSCRGPHQAPLKPRPLLHVSPCNCHWSPLERSKWQLFVLLIPFTKTLRAVFGGVESLSASARPARQPHFQHCARNSMHMHQVIPLHE